MRIRVSLVPSEELNAGTAEVGFVNVELANGLNCPTHDGNFRLTESVDALFHIADNAHGWVPCTERS